MTTEVRTLLHACNLYLFDVKEILEDFFGENRVDIQSYGRSLKTPTTVDEVTLVDSSLSRNVGCTVYIYFPEVVVSNEYNHSTTIYDLYTKFEIMPNGSLVEGLSMTRTTYTPEQAMSNYTHSHLPRAIGEWGHPCLGTGPIRRTIATLIAGFDADYWNLFCVELNSYVQVESIEGGPYIRLESIGSSSGYKVSFEDIKNYNWYRNEEFIINCYVNTDDRTRTILASSGEILMKLLRGNIIKFCYVNGQYDIAHSVEEFAILVSNVFLDIVREKGINRNFVNNTAEVGTYVYSEGSFYHQHSRPSLHRFEENTVILKFKGEDKILKLTTALPSNTEITTITLLNSSNLGLIYRRLIKLVNCVYGNKIKKEGKIRVV